VSPKEAVTNATPDAFFFKLAPVVGLIVVDVNKGPSSRRSMRGCAFYGKSLPIYFEVLMK